MKRLIEQKLIKWKNSAARKPLIICGARQIGKTYTLLDFGKKHYNNIAYCNFEDNGALEQIFTSDLNPERIVTAIGTLLGVDITKEKTLIIFDEIQACERALTSLKYFYEQANDYHIAAAGSLLDPAVNRGHYPFPAGKVDMLNMYPLTFEEFLIATGNEPLRDLIIEAYKTSGPFSLHEKALELYRIYLVAGGYPSAIKSYIEHGDFNLVRSEQSSISNAYISDMAKYSTLSGVVKSIEIYKTIVSQLAKDNSKFQYAVINSRARAKDYKLPLDWLITANVVLKCVRVTEGAYPINIYEDNNACKIYYSDIGLLTLHMGIAPNLLIQNINVSDKARGMLAESYVAQQLAAKDIALHYWESGNTAEVDFIADFDGAVIPIEVKSSENVRARSLQAFIKKILTCILYPYFL